MACNNGGCAACEDGHALQSAMHSEVHCKAPAAKERGSCRIVGYGGFTGVALTVVCSRGCPTMEWVVISCVFEGLLELLSTSRGYLLSKDSSVVLPLFSGAPNSLVCFIIAVRAVVLCMLHWRCSCIEMGIS